MYYLGIVTALACWKIHYLWLQIKWGRSLCMRTPSFLGVYVSMCVRVDVCASVCVYVSICVFLNTSKGMMKKISKRIHKMRFFKRSFHWRTSFCTLCVRLMEPSLVSWLWVETVFARLIRDHSGDSLMDFIFYRL